MVTIEIEKIVIDFFSLNFLTLCHHFSSLESKLRLVKKQCKLILFHRYKVFKILPFQYTSDYTKIILKNIQT